MNKRAVHQPLMWIVACMVGLLVFPCIARADAPYSTFFKDSYGNRLRSQPAYTPDKVIARDIFVDNGQGQKEYSPLKRPQDLFIDRHDHLYVADTDNNRIVQFDSSGIVIRIITVPESPLNQPQGVFVTDQGDIYIADTGNNRVIRLNKEGRLEKEFARPKSRWLNDSFVYEPTNVVVDRRGFLYIISNGNYQGIVQLDPDGRFYGFFGTNMTEAGFMDKLRAKIYSKEQLSRQVRLLPSAIRNIAIDPNGFIYSVSGSSSEQIKKLNIRGTNLWKGESFGEKLPFFNPTKAEAEHQISDVTVDGYGNVTVIDKTGSMVLQYDINGQLLFYWAGYSQAGTPQVGVTQSPVAIASNSRGVLYILDDALNVVQVYRPTKFGDLVHQAYALSLEGRYGESKRDWNQVVKWNARFTPAYEGLAQASIYEGHYEAAAGLFQMAGDSAGYSDAFWQIRLLWFQQNFPFLANAILILSVLLTILAKVKRRFGIRILPARKWKLTNATLALQLKQAFYILKHPLDGFSDLRYMRRGSYASAVILLVLVAAVSLIKTYLTSFTFDPVPVEDRSGASSLTWMAVVLLSYVICNYLIGSIYRGEGRFKDVAVGSAYALFPMILLGLPLALLSNVMTLSEAAIYGFFNSLAVTWCGLLFFWKIQSLHNYGVGETIVNIVLTGCSLIVMWVLVFIIFGMASELYGFLYSIYQEVSM